MHTKINLTKALLAASLFAMPRLMSAAPAEDVTNRFGFAGHESFPIDSQIALLHAADLNGDGRNDLIVVNNARSEIDVLYNQTGATNIPKPLKVTGKIKINELPPDARFRVETIPSEKRIASLVVADLNGDGRPDIAYFGGDPKELVILYNQGTNGWSAPKRFPIEDGQLTQNALVAGDLHGDGRNDLLLLGDPQLYLFTQKADHTFGEPEKIPYSGNVKSVQILDIDGDGRNDLLMVNWDNPTPFRFRLQTSPGRFGPEYYFPLDAIRSYAAEPLVEKDTPKIVTIAAASGRAQISEFVRKPAEALSGAFKQGQFQVMPLTRTQSDRRGMVWADVNGDGLPDLLVAEPESGQIALFLQKPDGTLDAPKHFSTLTGVTQLAVSDWNGDGKPCVFLLSADERQIGVTQLDEHGRLPFPTLIPLEGKPLAMAVGRLRPDQKPTLAVIVDQDGKRSLVTRSADGKRRTQKLSDDFKSNPTSMTFFDVNQDGLADLVVLIPYEKIKVLLQVDDKDFDEEDVAAPGGNVEEPWLSSADVDGDGKPELLLAQRNFVRAVVLKQEAAPQNSTNRSGWVFSVKEQINGADSSSRLVGAAAVPNGTNAVNSIFLLDAQRKALTLCERDSAGVWQVVRNIPLPYTAFGSLQPVSLGGAQPNAVAFLGKDAVGLLPLQGDIWDLSKLDSYETSIKDGHLTDVVLGDLNNDGRKDLVFLETEKNYLDIVTYDANHKLVPATRWQVFEERSFRSRRSELPEPREALVTDVTGDGKNDLVVLVHDRIIVYPQQ
jgi:hypothetical protein